MKPITVVCTGVVSGYHLLNIYALLENKYADREINLYVKLIDFWKKNIIPEKYIKLGISEYNLKVISGFDNIDSKKVNELVFIGVTYISYFELMKLFSANKHLTSCKWKLYSVDEGLGSHAYSYFRVLKRQYSESENKFLFLIKYNAKYLMTKILDFVFVPKHNRLFSTDNGVVKVDREFKDSLKQVIDYLSSDAMNKNIVFNDGDYIYIDQPLSDIKVCSRKFEEQELPILLNNFVKKEGKKLYVVNHPSRKFNSEGASVISIDGCVEELLSSLRKHNIEIKLLGFTSNALVTGNILYGFETHCLNHSMVDIKPLELNEKIIGYFKEFCRETEL